MYRCRGERANIGIAVRRHRPRTLGFNYLACIRRPPSNDAIEIAEKLESWGPIYKISYDNLTIILR